MKNMQMTYRSDDLLKLEADLVRAIASRIHEFKLNCKPIEILLSENKIGWLKGDESLLLFYNLLKRYDFVRCTYDEFINHFIGAEVPTSKIKFYQNLNELPYIFNDLQDAGYLIKAKHLHVQLAEHFVDKFDSPIGLEKLRSSFNKGIRNKRRKLFIDDCILNELLKC